MKNPYRKIERLDLAEWSFGVGEKCPFERAIFP